MTTFQTNKINRPALLASLLAGITLVPAPAFSQAATSGNCPPTSMSCSVSNQNVGDTNNPSAATDTVSTSSQSGTSSTSNASDLNFAPNFNPTIAQNPVNTTTGTITGGNTTGGNVTGGNTTGGNTNGTVTGGNTTGMVTGGDTASNSNAMGGASTGNTQTNNIDPSATGGTSTSNSGGNMLGGASASTGASNSTVGNTSATGGPSNAAVGNTSATSGNLTGGTNSTSNVNTTGASGASNSSTNIDQSNRSVTQNNQRWTFIPPVVPPTPPSVLAVGNIITETGTCGVLQKVIREPINGTYFGFFRSTKVQMGYTERLSPMVDEKGQQMDYRRVPLEDGTGYRLFGHQVTQYTSIIGLSGARNIAVGGGGGGGGWGQAGGGGSASMQQMVTTLQIRECEVGTIVRPTPPARVVYVEPARIRQ
ncbi:MAG: hypothetical protein WCO82_05520 [Sphingomonadales bacterium]|jgi:hypothetical protein